jgi:hypothetical protein
MDSPTPTDQEQLAARVRELQQAIAAGRQVADEARLLRRQVDDWAAELRRAGTPPTDGYRKMEAKLQEKMRIVESGRQAREELQRIDPISLRGLR